MPPIGEHVHINCSTEIGSFEIQLERSTYLESTGRSRSGSSSKALCMQSWQLSRPPGILSACRPCSPAGGRTADLSKRPSVLSGLVLVVSSFYYLMVVGSFIVTSFLHFCHDTHGWIRASQLPQSPHSHSSFAPQTAPAIGTVTPHLRPSASTGEKSFDPVFPFVMIPRMHRARVPAILRYSHSELCSANRSLLNRKGQRLLFPRASTRRNEP